MKREDYISWQEYFMALAVLAAERSKDPSSQVGACIVSPDKNIVSLGYNGWPRGIDEDDLPWERDGDFLSTKYAYVVHSEPNAILNANSVVRGCDLYVTLFPCNECAKLVIQSGIKQIFYLDDKYEGTDGDIASKKMLDLAGVKHQKFQTTGRTIELKI
jgi:dCMP deaminase